METGISECTEVIQLVHEIDLNIPIVVGPTRSHEGITEIGVTKTRMRDCVGVSEL